MEPYRSAAEGPTPFHESVMTGVMTFFEAMVRAAVIRATEEERLRVANERFKQQTTTRLPASSRMPSPEVLRQILEELAKQRGLRDVVFQAQRRSFATAYAISAFRGPKHITTVEVDERLIMYFAYSPWDPAARQRIVDVMNKGLDQVERALEDLFEVDLPER